MAVINALKGLGSEERAQPMPNSSKAQDEPNKPKEGFHFGKYANSKAAQRLKEKDTQRKQSRRFMDYIGEIKIGSLDKDRQKQISALFKKSEKTEIMNRQKNKSAGIKPLGEENGKK
jgi:hypothetical protein